MTVHQSFIGRTWIGTAASLSVGSPTIEHGV